MSEADGAARAGQGEQALTILKQAAASFPADQTPWLQMAQIKFERAEYGDAIGNALEALQREPDNKVANSIVALSGLRLSSKALADLKRHNNVSGPLRVEARELARQLRASVGEELLLPAPSAATAPAHKPRKPVPASAAAPAKTGGGGGAADPFSALK